MLEEEIVTLKIQDAPLRLQNYKEKLDLDILRMAIYNIILGLL